MPHHIHFCQKNHAPAPPPPGDYARSLLIRDALKDNLNALYRNHRDEEITIMHMCHRTISDVGVEEPHKALLVLCRRFAPDGTLLSSKVVVNYKYECIGARHGQDVEEALLLKTEKLLAEKYADAIKPNCEAACLTYVVDVKK